MYQNQGRTAAWHPLLGANTKNLDKAACSRWRPPFQLAWAVDRRRHEVSWAAPKVGGPASEERPEFAAQEVAEPLCEAAVAKVGGSPPNILGRAY